MKKLLRMIAEAQHALINRYRGMKDPSCLGKIAGATLVTNGKMSFSEYGEIGKTLDEHTKEWRRFNEDKNKIVIEKNFFLRCLGKLSSYHEHLFLFRTANDSGHTYVNYPDDFHIFHPSQNEIGSDIVFIVCICFIAAGICLNPSYFLGLLFIPYAYYYNKRALRIFRKKLNNWKKAYVENPHLLFYKQPYSSPTEYASSGDNKKLGRLTELSIDISKSQYYEEYQRMLKALTIDAHRLDGKIVWFWYYVENLPSEIISVDGSGIYGYGNVQVKLCLRINDFNLIPAIETEHSFIFSFENYPYQSEIKPFVSDLLIKKLNGVLAVLNVDETMFIPIQ